MNRSKHTGRACPLLTRTGLVAAFLATAGVVAVHQSAHADGPVHCWGRNYEGQCDVPADLGPCSNVAGGYLHSIALRSDGTVRCWGRGTVNTGDGGEFGQSIVPADLGSCVSIAGGYWHSLAVQASGLVRCWGRNDYGQCNVPADLGPCSILAAGVLHTIALRNDGVEDPCRKD